MLLIPLKEHRVKLVNIFMQERRLLCKMQINPGYLIIRMSKKQTEHLDVTAALNIRHCKSMPTKMGMKPIYAGFLFYPGKELLDHIGVNCFLLSHLQKHIGHRG